MKLKIINARLSFPKLFQAEQYEGKGPYRYGAQLWVAVDSPDKKKIDEAIRAVAAEAWSTKATIKLAEILPDKKACCWIDGARKDAEGYWVLSSYRKQEDGKPLVLDTDKTPLAPDDGKPYAGCFVNASVEIYATGKPNEGIRCGLVGVQFSRDGDAFGGGGRPNADDFDEIAEGAGVDALT